MWREGFALPTNPQVARAATANIAFLNNRQPQRELSEVMARLAALEAQLKASMEEKDRLEAEVCARACVCGCDCVCV